MSLIDAIDLRILSLLQNEGRLTNARLAERVGLSASPCLARTRRLERHGFILRYGASIDIGRLSRQHIVVHTQVTLLDRRAASIAAFERVIKATPEALSCYLVGGDFDYLVKFVCSGMQHLAELMPRLTEACPAIVRYCSFVAITCIKDESALPLSLLVEVA